MARSKRAGRAARGAQPPPIPPGFLERITGLLGDETPAFLSALEREETGLRLNSLRASVQEGHRRLRGWGEPLPHLPEGLLVTGEERPGKHPYHAAGLYYLQDPAAMMVGALVDPRPGEWVADLAAAPGGKATHLAARMENRGFLLANDPVPARARELAGNLERLGVRNAVVTMESVERLAARFSASFHRVLLDAPCSGEAMFSRSDAARRDWSASAVEGCARRQEELLRQAGRLVRPGGLLVYSTCTFSPEEDERVVAIFLDAAGDFVVELAAAPPHAAPGRPDWAGRPDRPELARTLRFWPHRAPGAGHFVALLRRRESPAREAGPGHFAAASDTRGLSAAEHGLLEEFALGALTEGVLPDPGELLVRGEEVFRPPEGGPALEGLRSLRPGWWLGGLRPGRFEPAHALAMGLRPGEARCVVDLAAEEIDRARAWLRGETLERPGPAGWVLVSFDGLPLGWGKRVGITVKNHLPKGLRGAF